MGKVTVIGGRFNRSEIEIRKEPKRIEILGDTYERIDDPDTGEPLGAYAIAGIVRPF